MSNLSMKLTKIGNLSMLNRFYSVSNNEINPIMTVRNPRNLERMRIAYKPSGYHLEKPGRCYWHKLKIDVSGRHVSATVEHFINGEILKASSKEWCIKKQLYRTYDTSAFINVGRVLAQRCLESGLTEIRCDIKPTTENGKVAGFLTALQEGGVSLREPEQFKSAQPWDQHRPEKPWEVTD